MSAKMAAASFGEFDNSKEDWLSYTEQMQQYFVANAVSEERQRATLLSTCGHATYYLIEDLVAPEKPTARTFEELLRLMNAHKNPQPLTIVQRFHLHIPEHKWKRRPFPSMLPSSGDCQHTATLDML